MKIKYALSLLATFFILSSHAQDSTLAVREWTVWHTFYLDGKRIPKNRLKSLLKTECPKAYTQLTAGIRASILEIGAGLPGGALVGWEAARYTATGQINLPRLFIGLSLCAASGWAYYHKRNNYMLAVMAYNKYKTGSRNGSHRGIRLRIY